MKIKALVGALSVAVFVLKPLIVGLTSVFKVLRVAIALAIGSRAAITGLAGFAFVITSIVGVGMIGWKFGSWLNDLTDRKFPSLAKAIDNTFDSLGRFANEMRTAIAITGQFLLQTEVAINRINRLNNIITGQAVVPSFLDPFNERTGGTIIEGPKKSGNTLNINAGAFQFSGTNMSETQVESIVNKSIVNLATVLNDDPGVLSAQGIGT